MNPCARFMRQHVYQQHKRDRDPIPPSYEQHQRARRRRTALPLAVRYAVWNEWQGGPHVGCGPCHVCGKVITQQDFECGHVTPHCAGGSDDVSNLRPTCRTCNRSMGRQQFDAFCAVFFSRRRGADGGGAAVAGRPPPPPPSPGPSVVRGVVNVAMDDDYDVVMDDVPAPPPSGGSSNPFLQFAFVSPDESPDITRARSGRGPRRDPSS